MDWFFLSQTGKGAVTAEKEGVLDAPTLHLVLLSQHFQKQGQANRRNTF